MALLGQAVPNNAARTCQAVRIGLFSGRLKPFVILFLDQLKRMQRQNSDSRTGDQMRDVLRGMLSELSVQLDVPSESSKIARSLNDTLQDVQPESHDAMTVGIMKAAQSIGIRLAPIDVQAADIWQLLLDQYPVAIIDRQSLNPTTWVLSNIALLHCESSKIDSRGRTSETLSKRQIASVLSGISAPILFVAQPTLVCDTISTNSAEQHSNLSRVEEGHQGHHGGHHGEHHEKQARPQRQARLCR
jgi:hypothetical protein